MTMTRALLASPILLVAFMPSAADDKKPERFKDGPSYKATARIDIAKPLNKISEGIYGVAEWPKEKREAYRIPILRWGGNPSSRYNWKLNVDAAGADWFFKNRGKLITDLADTGYLKSIKENQEIGATCYLTIPMTGWVAKDDNSYSFSVKKYGPQKATEPGYPDIGNGVKANGKFVTDNDANDAAIKSTPGFVGEAVRFVADKAGNAAAKGVKYWVLDNEPMLWYQTHRDVCPQPLSYADLWGKTLQYGEAIKKADPTCKVAGFCSWGYQDLFYSAVDRGKDNYGKKADYEAHNQVGLAEWYLKKCADYKKDNKKSLVDVMDVHWYPQGKIKGQDAYLGKGMDPELNAYRLRSVRDLWDPYYTQESWILDVSKEPVALIRRVKKWIRERNPGMEFCLGEYNFGGSDNITGGLAQSDVFGVLAREGVDLAFIWNKPEGTQELGWQLFRNYDGAKNGFGDIFLDMPREPDNKDLSVYPAKRSKDEAITISLVNKNLNGPCELTLDVGRLKGMMRIWRFDQNNLEKVVEVGSGKSVDGTIKLTLPAASASMVVIMP